VNIARWCSIYIILIGFNLFKNLFHNFYRACRPVHKPVNHLQTLHTDIATYQTTIEMFKGACLPSKVAAGSSSSCLNGKFKTLSLSLDAYLGLKRKYGQSVSINKRIVKGIKNFYFLISIHPLKLLLFNDFQLHRYHTLYNVMPWEDNFHRWIQRYLDSNSRSLFNSTKLSVM
jgi:hypothetical protein